MNKNLMILSLVFGIVTFFITTFYLGNVSKEQKFKSELIPVVVSKLNIPAKNVVIKDMLEIKSIPRAYVLDGTTSKIEEVIDKITLVPFFPGEQIALAKLTLRNKQLGLSVVIPKDMRAVSVEVDASASIAGLIKPGDMVDVVCTLGDIDRTVTILQNVPILAIDQQMESGGANSGKISNRVIATFALDLKDSEKLIQGSFKGQLKLLLRPINDNTLVKSSGASTAQLLPYAPAGKGIKYEGYNIRIIRGTDVTNKKF